MQCCWPMSRENGPAGSRHSCSLSGSELIDIRSPRPCFAVNLRPGERTVARAAAVPYVHRSRDTDHVIRRFGRDRIMSASVGCCRLAVRTTWEDSWHGYRCAKRAAQPTVLEPAADPDAGCGPLSAESSRQPLTGMMPDSFPRETIKTRNCCPRPGFYRTPFSADVLQLLCP